MFEKIISKNPAENNNSATSTPAPATPPSPSGQSTPSAAKAPSAGQRNILSSDVEIKGVVQFQNDLLVDGKIDGEISSDGALTVAENAHLKAEIKTRTVVIYGKVHGNIVATDRVEVKSSAEMVGDIKAATLSIEAGAIFVGKSEVGTPSAQPQNKPHQKNEKPHPNENAKKHKSGGNSQKDLIKAS